MNRQLIYDKLPEPFGTGFARYAPIVATICIHTDIKIQLAIEQTKRENVLAMGCTTKLVLIGLFLP